MADSTTEVLAFLDGEPDDVIDRVADVEDAQMVMSLHLAERRGRRRKRVLEVIEARGLELTGIDPEAGERSREEIWFGRLREFNAELAERLAERAFKRPSAQPLSPDQAGALGDLVAALVEGAAKDREWPPFVPPAESAFEDADTGRVWDFMEAPDLEAIADAMLVSDVPGIDDARHWRITYLWRRTGGAKNGKASLGRCQRTSGLAAYYSGQEFIIWAAADHARASIWSLLQIAGLLYHELLHVGVSDTWAPTIVAHDAELFWREVQLFGAWQSDLRPLVEQLALF